MKLNSFFTLTAVTFSLVGCLKTRDDLKPDAPTSKPQQQQTVVQQQAQAAPAPRRQDPIQTEQSDEQMRMLNGRIENLEQGQAEIKRTQAEVAKQAVKEEMDLKFKAYEEELRALQAQVQAIVAAQEAKAAAAAEMKTKTPKDFFDRGEELFKEKKWKEAISSYNKYREVQPKGPHYADATYKMGVCFQELNMKDEAKTFYEDVIQKAPKSREAKKAAIRLKSLK